MWIAIWAFLKPLLTTKNILIASGIAALTFAFFWYGNKRASEGYQSGQVAQLQTDRTQFQEEIAQFKSQLASSQSQIDQLTSMIKAEEATISSLKGQLTSLDTQLSSRSKEVADLPDAGVLSDIQSKLGGAIGDIAVLRKNDEIISEYPIVVKENDVLKQTVSADQSEITTLNSKLDLITSQRDNAINLSNEAIANYIRSYNAAQRHHSLLLKVITFGIVHDRHLDLPRPIAVPK